MGVAYFKYYYHHIYRSHHHHHHHHIYTYSTLQSHNITQAKGMNKRVGVFFFPLVMKGWKK